MKGIEASTLIRTDGPPGPVESFGLEPLELTPVPSEAGSMNTRVAPCEPRIA